MCKRCLRIAVAVLALALGVCVCLNGPVAVGQDTEVLFSQDFEDVAPGGPPPAPIRDNSGWAGSTVPLRVVDSGDPRFGKVLRGEVTGFAQLMLGALSGIRNGRFYRISLDAATTGAQRPEIFLRLGPSPYRVYMSSTETTNESLQRFSFVGKSAHDVDQQIVLMLRMNGVTTITIDNIRIEHVVGDLPESAPPVPGNLVFNASFENRWDGWFVRGDIDFLQVTDAADGAHVARLAGRCVLSSTWLRLSQRCEYMVRARVRAVGKPATLTVGLSNYIFPRGGSTGKSESMALEPQQGWKTVSFRWRPPPSAGKITRWAEYFVNLRNTTGNDSTVWVDAVEVRAVMPDSDLSSFAPMASAELAIFTNMPQNVATAGEPVKVAVQSTGAVDRVSLRVLDEEDREARRLSLDMQEGRRTSAVIANLRCGYWRLVATDVRATTEVVRGETFLAVVPSMPDIETDEWMYGSHIPLDPDLRQACWKLGLRLDRLHDTGKETKWTRVQPQPGEWLFADDAIEARLASGHAILGSIAGMPAWVPRAKVHPKTGKPLPRKDTRGNVGMTDKTFPLWEAYARRCAEHWAGSIDMWEITNEPNLSGMSPEDYAELFAVAARGIRQGNPQATIVSLGGATPPGSSWIREAVEAGALEDADALSFHGYGNTTWSCIPGPDSLADSMALLQEAARGAGHPDTAIWDSECGVEVRTAFRKYYVPHGGDARSAARMFAKSAACARAAGLRKVFYYSAAGTTHAGDGGLRCFSDFNGVMKMPVVPLAVAIAMLEGRTYAGERSDADRKDIVDLTFEGRGGRVRMVWSLRDDADVVLDGNPRRIVSMWGRDIGGRSDDRETQTLRVTQAPVYIIYDLE